MHKYQVAELLNCVVASVNSGFENTPHQGVHDSQCKISKMKCTRIKRCSPFPQKPFPLLLIVH